MARYKHIKIGKRMPPPIKPMRMLKFGHLRLEQLLSRLCDDAGVVVWRGDIATKMIKMMDVVQLLRYLAERYSPPHTALGFDRLSLVTWLNGLEGEMRLFDDPRSDGPRNGAGYARRVEVEIRRIARMKEPMRTVMAVELMGRLKEARTIATAMRGYLKVQYGDMWEARMDGRWKQGEEWWRSLEKLMGVMRPEQAKLNAPEQ